MKERSIGSRIIRIIICFIIFILFFSTIGIDKAMSEEYVMSLERREAYIKFLNEKYADYEEVPYGLDITKKTDLVGICYSTWFTEILRGRTEDPPNITNILAGKEEWGRPYSYHWWAEPELGFYKSDDEEVIRTHMTQLSGMGANYIIIDNTNVSMSWKNSNEWYNYITLPCSKILDVICEMREEGKKTPYVVFWNSAGGSRGWDVVNAIYEEFHAIEKWKDCFVYWEGKPFMLVTNIADGEPAYDMTIRRQWGLQSSYGPCEWSFLNAYNQPTYDMNEFVEQTCVCTATQQDYMSESSAYGRNHGIFMYHQWANAFDYRPKAITITWWNEWCAIMLLDREGNKRFTDNYNQEYSRDIEPMKGGHGDKYYVWTKMYIDAYRNLEECPVLVDFGYEEIAVNSR